MCAMVNGAPGHLHLYHPTLLVCAHALLPFSGTLHHARFEVRFSFGFTVISPRPGYN